MLTIRYINFLFTVVQFVVLVQILQGRPSFDPQRVLNKLSKRTTSRKVDCGNILMLIDSQTDLFKCLLQAYKIDVQDIVFPGSTESTEDDYIEPIPQIRGVPYCARSGSTFCEHIENYPYNRVQTILEKNNTFSGMFGADISPEEFVNRVDLNDEKFLCEAHHKIVFPRIGKTKDNSWQYIVNQGNNEQGYIQGVMIETCAYPGDPCELVNTIPSGYITSCKQKYMYRRLLSITDKGTTVKEFFELPSACCCSYKRDIGFLRKFGSTLASGKKKY